MEEVYGFLHVAEMRLRLKQSCVYGVKPEQGIFMLARLWNAETITRNSTHYLSAPLNER